MSKALEEAIAFAVLALGWLAISVGAFVRARRGGPRSQWRYIGLLAFVQCSLLVLNLHGVRLTGPGGPGVTHESPGG